MLYPSLLAVHVFCAILWGGGAVIGGFFLLPTVAKALNSGDLDPVGLDAVRAQFGFGKVLGIFSTLTVLCGLVLLGLRAVESPAWFHSPEGVTVCLGVLAGLGAFVIGIAILRPRSARVLALALAAKGSGPVSEARLALVAEQAKMLRSARISAWHLVAAALLMASHGVVTAVLAR